MSTQIASSSDESLKPTNIMNNLHALFPSIAMLAGMRLDVFTPLKDGPLAAKELAGILGVQADKLTPLLYALVTANLLKVENEIFSNTKEADKFLLHGQEDYLGGLWGLYTMFLETSLKTAESIKTGEPQAKFDFHTLPDNELLAYFKKQIHSSLSGGKEIAEKIAFSKFTNLLDAGGGTGGVAISICKKYQTLKATVADLPKVTKLAEQFIAEADMSAQINVEPVDLCASAPAGKYDAAILRALIKTLSKEEAQLLLKHVGQTMLPGGQIFIFGNILNNDCLGPPASIALSLVFLNVYDQGKAYTENEYRTMLTAAGFADITIDYNLLSGGMGVIRARKQ